MSLKDQIGHFIYGLSNLLIAILILGYVLLIVGSQEGSPFIAIFIIATLAACILLHLIAQVMFTIKKQPSRSYRLRSAAGSVIVTLPFLILTGMVLLIVLEETTHESLDLEGDLIWLILPLSYLCFIVGNGLLMSPFTRYRGSMKNVTELISTGSMVLGFLGLVYLFIVVPIVNHGWTAPFRDLTMDHHDAIPKAWLGVFFLTMALYFLLTSFIQFLIMTGIRRGKLFPEE